MATEPQLVHEEPLNDDESAFPVSVGWTQAAIAVNSILNLPLPMLLKMDIEGHAPLLIDFRYHAFAWTTPLEHFPVDAVHTGMETEPTHLDGAPLFELPGQNLDGLLWEMGINSFGGARASWLPPGGRFKLSRWPNLTKHSHTIRQMHMMAMLANTHVSAGELAAFAGVDESDAQRLINALSLMRILNHAPDAAPPEMVAPPVAEAEAEEYTTDKPLSLFARLRNRLGR